MFIAALVISERGNLPQLGLFGIKLLDVGKDGVLLGADFGVMSLLRLRPAYRLATMLPLGFCDDN